MKYARVFDNSVIEVVDMDDCVVSREVNGEVMLRPIQYGDTPTYNAVMQRLQERYVIEPTHVTVEYEVVPLFTDVNTCKLIVIGLIDMWRDDNLCRDVHAHGRYWQADRRSRELLSDAITLANAGEPLPPVWRDAANSNMVISSVGELVAIAAAIAQSTQAVYPRSWQLKEYVAGLPVTEDTITTLCKLTWNTQLPT